MKQIHIFVTGFVQGVGFRVFVKKKAQRLNITGWVKNLSDRRVEAVLQGESEDIEQLIRTLKRGPFLSDVKHIVAEEEETNEEFEEFGIVKG